MGVADTQGRGVLEATATHPRVVVAGASPTVAAGASLTVAAGVSPMVEAGVSPTVVAGDSPMVEVGVKVVAPTISGISPVSQKPT